MSKDKSTSQLGAEAAQARNELNTLRQQISRIPDRLSAVERSLRTAKGESAIRSLIEERARIQEEAEVKPLLIPRAQIKVLQAEAAQVRAQEADVRRDIPAAVEADVKARADLQVAQSAATSAAKRRGKLEADATELAAKAQKLETQAEEEEARLS